MRLTLVRPRYNGLVVTPPMGIGYLSGYLKRHGHECHIVDAQRDNLTLAQTVAEILALKPDAVGVTCLTAFYGETVALCQALKKQTRIPYDVPVLVGGVHPTALPEDTLTDTGADHVFVGEAEAEILKFANGERLGQIVPCGPIQNLDDIGWADWEGLGKYPYAPWGAVARHSNRGYLMTTRGCPYSCTFCAAPMFTERHLRFRSIPDVVDELQYLITRGGIAEFVIVDDNFTARRSHTQSFCEEILRRGIKMDWACENGIRADRVDQELLRLMHRAGCYRVAFGVESANPDILRRCKKQETIGDITKAIGWAKDTGMEVRGCFIVGLPGETEQTLKETYDWARASRLDQAAFTILSVLPGSELYDTLKGKYIPNWADPSFKTVEFVPEGLTKKQLTQWQGKMLRGFYASPRRALRLVSQIKPQQLRSLWQRVREFHVV